VFQWTHQDARGIAQASVDATARCQLGAWAVDSIGQSSGGRSDDFLALIVESLIVRQEIIDAGDPSLLSQLAPIGATLTLSVVQGTAPDVDHVNAQVILLKTWEVYARALGWNMQTPAQLSATTGRPLTTTQQTQANAIAIVAIVVGILALAGIIAFVVWNVHTVIDRELARKAQAQELMQAHADCQTMLQNHAAAEKQAGHAIPFTTPELQIMARLGQLQDAAMQGFKATLVPGLSVWNGDNPSPTSIVQGAVTLAIVLGFVYFLIRPKPF
jgi:hypothetical protein